MTLEGAQDKIAELEEEVRFLKSAMGIGVRFPSIFRFTKREQALLGVLATRRVMTHDMMILAAYGNGADGGPETARNVLQVNMVVLRKKLKRFGIVVLVAAPGRLRDQRARPANVARNHATADNAMSVAYNEIDPYCCAWLENLMVAGAIPTGKIFCRDIRDLQSDELRGFDQIHFFAGIGGWPYALELAGWAGPCWTGSAPCQPFSSVGKQHGFDDPRHLWPAWRRLISERRPPVIFGEQSAEATDWFALVRSDLVQMDYAVGAIPVEAACVGAPHYRDRFWFVADANSEPLERSSVSRSQSHSWSDESGLDRVVDGVPARMDKLRALGNAIVPQAAAAFVQAYLETRRPVRVDDLFG